MATLRANPGSIPGLSNDPFDAPTAVEGDMEYGGATAEARPGLVSRIGGNRNSAMKTLAAGAAITLGTGATLQNPDVLRKLNDVSPSTFSALAGLDHNVGHIPDTSQPTRPEEAAQLKAESTARKAENAPRFDEGFVAGVATDPDAAPKRRR